MLELNIQYQRNEFCLQVSKVFDAPITGILGASGSGKSTLLGLIAGLLKPQSGKIVLNNQCLFDQGGKINTPAHRRRIGLVFQDGQLLPHLSVHRNLLYGYNNLSEEDRKFSVPQVCELLEINHLLARRPNTLSGGEKQRVALGRAILYSPHLLLLDEPLSALDERLKKQILPFFLHIKNECKIPMIYVSHSLNEIEFLTSQHFIMNGGTFL